MYSVDMRFRPDLSVNGWVVGDRGTILQWDGSAWIEVSSPTSTDLRSISIVSTESSWAVGWDGEILNWNGSDWSVVDSPTRGRWLESVTMISPISGWIVGGDRAILRYTGASKYFPYVPMH